MTDTEMLERVVESTLVRVCRDNCVWPMKGENVPGFPDRILIGPDGRIAFVETKRPGKGLEPLQKMQRDRLRRQGHLCEKIDHPDEVQPFIESWLGL